MSSSNAWSDVANPTVKQSNASLHDEKSTHSHQHDGNGHSHQHGAINVGKEFAKPELGLVLHKDEVDGYNLFIDVNNFNFQLPLKSAKQLTKLGMRKDSRTKFANAAGGHAHLYIGDKKIGRIYGPRIHLPSAMFQEGLNTIRVSLNDDNHNNLSIDGKAVQASLTLDTRKADPVVFEYSTSEFSSQ